MAWYTIRMIDLFSSKSDRSKVFEERVVCFTAKSWTEAHEKARIESRSHADQNYFEACAQRDGYELNGDEPTDGHEVWPVRLEARLSLEKFYEQRYSAFRYTPARPG